MDSKICLEEFQALEGSSNCAIKEEPEYIEFNYEDLHHSIDIKEESSDLESQLEECDAQGKQQFECYACETKFYNKLKLKKHLRDRCSEKLFGCETKLHLERHKRKSHKATFGHDEVASDEENDRIFKSIEDNFESDDDDGDDADKKLKSFTKTEQWKTSECLRDNTEMTIDLPPGAISNYEQQSTRKVYTERPTICPICYQDIETHFTRHLLRHHKNNKEVILIKSLEPRSKERLAIVTALRKRGYFHLKTERNVLNPIRTANIPNTDYFLCTYCLGHYSKKRLYIHVKTCANKPPDHVNSGRSCLARAQTYMATLTSKNHEFLGTSRIKHEVFDIMRPDDVSSVAKSDPLICLYGEALLNKYKNQHIATVVSNKIREIARLLIASKTMNPEILGLFDTLKPEMFPLLISATKVISGFDERTKSFKAPSLAMHIGSNLKMLCDVALKVVTEKRNIPSIQWNDRGRKITEINNLKELIRGYWCAEISTFALKALKEKSQELQSSVEEFQGKTDQQQPIKDLSEQRNVTKKVNPRVRWSYTESELVTNHFHSHIKKKIAPKKHECEVLLAQHKDIFVNKNWVKIKSFVYNTFRDK